MCFMTSINAFFFCIMNYVYIKYFFLFHSSTNHYFNLGPSVMVDTACSSGATAFYHAYQALCKGECDAAIVSSSAIQLKPEQALAFKKLKLLSESGKCKSFDASG